ncbi:MAG: GTPase HflX [Rhodospirillaceae bacterium]
MRDPEASLEEVAGLALAIDLEVGHKEWIKVARPQPATLFGSGTVERLGKVISDIRDEGGVVHVVIVDAPLSHVQQRNLERAWDCKVIDRTGLILEIFGARARTREGRLQVELAALSYQRSRLVRSWTHLERQRGGAGFMGGPGERQIELDRRMIDNRIDRIKGELKDVKRTRTLHRDARKRLPRPIVALVGYTNAGKSTLFNRLTEAQVVAKDQLFATLDPTMRAIQLPTGQRAILSDTVGFISNLPHELVEAFHATLEEVMEADLILHVRDACHPDTDAQKSDVLAVLAEIGMDTLTQQAMIEVLNKIDRLPPEERNSLRQRALRANQTTVCVSALSGEGLDELAAAVSARLSGGFEELEIDLLPDDGATLAWLYRNGDVIERNDTADIIHLKVRLAPAKAGQFAQRQGG